MAGLSPRVLKSGFVAVSRGVHPRGAATSGRIIIPAGSTRRFASCGCSNVATHTRCRSFVALLVDPDCVTQSFAGNRGDLKRSDSHSGSDTRADVRDHGIVWLVGAKPFLQLGDVGRRVGMVGMHANGGGHERHKRRNRPA